jgi:transposase
MSTGLREALEPLLREVESLNERIQEYDRRIEKMAKQTYPETALLKQALSKGIHQPARLEEYHRRQLPVLRGK